MWIGLLEPSDDVLRQVQAEVGLHDLAIEDARHAHQRPKLEQYGDALFIVARTAQMVEGRIAFGETHLFVGRGYVVSVRHGASTSYTPVRERCESRPTSLSEGEDYILYAILDFIVDNYMPVIEAIHGEVEMIEESVLTRRSAGAKASGCISCVATSCGFATSSCRLSTFAAAWRAQACRVLTPPCIRSSAT